MIATTTHTVWLYNTDERWKRGKEAAISHLETGISTGNLHNGKPILHYTDQDASYEHNEQGTTIDRHRKIGREIQRLARLLEKRQ